MDSKCKFPDGQDEEGMILEMESKIATIAVLGRTTTISVPEAYVYDLDPGNHFGYLHVYGVILGQPMSTGIARCVPMEYHSKVASQMAGICFELSRVTYAQIGGLSFDSGTKDDQIVMVRFSMAGGEIGSEPFLRPWSSCTRTDSSKIKQLHPHIQMRRIGERRFGC